MRRRTWIGAIVGVPLAAAAIVLGIGWALPVRHVAVGERTIAAAPAAVAARFRDVPALPRWRGEVKAVRVVARQGTATDYVEDQGSMRIALHLIETVPDRQFTSTITDPTLPFGGTWTIDLTPQGAATRVRITERGTVTNPLFRFVSRFVLGQDGTICTQLDDLARSF